MRCRVSRVFETHRGTVIVLWTILESIGKHFGANEDHFKPDSLSV
jgi:hypothetical protein